MTHPAILERAADVAAYIDDNGGASTLEARGIVTNPRATAVASLFAAKLLGKADEIPIEDLVTPDSVSAFRRLLRDDDAVAALRPGLSGMGLVWPRVHPQPDGTVLVQLVPKRHDGTNGAEAAGTSKEQPTIGLRVRLVSDPDDWRVEWSGVAQTAESAEPPRGRQRSRKPGARSRSAKARKADG